MRSANGPLAVVVELVRGILGLILVLGMFAGVGAAVVKSVIGQSAQEVVVPQLRGLDAQQAQRAAARVGLQVKIVGKEWDDHVEPERVVRCKPYAGKRVKRGRVIECTLSRGPRTVRMPKLVGRTLAAAQAKLDEVGLNSREILRRASDKDWDLVLEQDPAPETDVPRDKRVTLVVSGGEDYGVLRTDDGEPWSFRRLKIIVPQGPPLQRVQVLLRAPGSKDEDTEYDRVHRPGDSINVNLAGRKGWRVEVRIDGKTMLKTRL